MIVKVRVIPQAKHNKVEALEWREERLYIKVRVTAPALGGKANKALQKILSEYFELPKSAIYIVKGQLSRDKLVEMPNIDLSKYQVSYYNQLNIQLF